MQIFGTFGFFGISPLYTPARYRNYDCGTEDTHQEIRLPVTPAILKEKIITSALLIAGMPVVYMIVFS
ncbi:TPA: hypothetical protein L9K97_005103 [Klebsiella pneumoniae]|nr:hypothetical protein [Klebsiella pneumoniae]